jgi:hypothetical protein
MLIREVAGADAQAPRLMALAEFLRSRAQDQAVEPRISRDAFLKLAANLGMSVTSDQLKNMIQQPPLSGIIQDVTGTDDLDGSGEVIFRGAETGGDDDVMTPDMAKQTVDSMAKRATGNAMKGLR